MAWKSISGTLQKDTVSGNYRINFGGNGVKEIGYGTPEEIKTALETLSGEDRLDSSAIKNLTGGGSNYGWINVKDYGAVGNGTTNDAAAIQAAADAIADNGGLLIFPPGKYLCNASITLSKPTKVVGSGGAFLQNDPVFPNEPTGNTNTVVLTNSATLDLFIVNANRCEFEDIALYCTNAAPSTGHGILWNKAQSARMNKVSIMRFFVNVEYKNGYLWAMDQVFLWGAKTFNLIIANEDLADAGDSTINNSWFYSGMHAGMTHLKYLSSGGLKISNTKFNMQGVPALHCIDAPINQSTVILQVVNCSIENFTGHGIRCIPVGSASFSGVIILGNTFGPGSEWATGNCITMGGHAVLDERSPSNVVIDDNIFGCPYVGVNTGGIYGNYSKYSIFTTAAYTNIGAGNIYRTQDGHQNIAPVFGAHNVIHRLDELKTLPDIGGTLYYNMDRSVNQALALTRDINVRLTEMLPGETALLRVKQDATGGRNLTIYDTTSYGIRKVNQVPNSYTFIRIFADDQLGPVLFIEDYTFLGSYTTTQKNALTGLFAGARVFDNTLNKYSFYNGTTWETITSA